MCDLVQGAMGRSGVCGSGGGVVRVVCERVRWATGCSGVEWFPMDILCGVVVGADIVSTLGGRACVCTGGGGGTGAVGLWESTLGASEGFYLGAGWVWCCGGGRKMSQMWVRASKHSLCSVAVTSLMAHDRKWRAWNMQSSDMTIGCVRYEW